MENLAKKDRFTNWSMMDLLFTIDHIKLQSLIFYETAIIANQSNLYFDNEKKPISWC